jgi:hypothetical protein
MPRLSEISINLGNPTNWLVVTSLGEREEGVYSLPVHHAGFGSEACEAARAMNKLRRSIRERGQ